MTSMPEGTNPPRDTPPPGPPATGQAKPPWLIAVVAVAAVALIAVVAAVAVMATRGSTGDGAFAQSVLDVDPSSRTDQPPAYTDYVRITDDTGALSIEVPVTWTRLDTEPSSRDEPAIRARPERPTDPDASRQTAFVNIRLADADTDLVGFLDDAQEEYVDDCVDRGRFDLDDPGRNGQWILMTSCNEDGFRIAVVAASANDDRSAPVILMGFGALHDRDLEVLDRIWASLEITP